MAQSFLVSTFFRIFKYNKKAIAMKPTFSQGWTIEKPNEVKKVLEFTESDIEYVEGLSLAVNFTKTFSKNTTPQKAFDWFCDSRWFEICKRCDMTIDEVYYD